jgi:hypothetical protein
MVSGFSEASNQRLMWIPLFGPRDCPDFRCQTRRNTRERFPRAKALGRNGTRCFLFIAAWKESGYP